MTTTFSVSRQRREHIEKLAGKPIQVPDAASHPYRLSGPFASAEFFCEAFAIENAGESCLPCSGVDSGPSRVDAPGLAARLFAVTRRVGENNVTECNLSIQSQGSWFILHQAVSCAACDHPPFMAGPLAKLAKEPPFSTEDSWKHFEAAVSEELAFKDVVPGGTPELVLKIRSGSLGQVGFSEDSNALSRLDERNVIVCGAGASGRWSCVPTRAFSRTIETLELVDGKQATTRTEVGTAAFENGALVIKAPANDVGVHAGTIPLAFP